MLRYMRPPSILDRRTFLKASLAATSVFAITGFAGAAETKPVRIGLIGAGSRGSSLMHTLLQFPEVRIGAVCDIEQDRAAKASRAAEEKTGQAPEVYAGNETIWEKLIARGGLDAVIIATPWEWHTRMAVAAMKAGIRPGVEVPAAITVSECRELVRVSEHTGIPCTMLENVCYFRNVMALLRMARQNCFGELLHAEAGYQHDGRELAFTKEGKLSWRGQHAATQNGNLYPTHAIGPVAQWMNIGRGDRFVSLTSVSTNARGLREYAREKFGPDHPLAKREYAQGDVNTTFLQTASGRTVTLYYNVSTWRPYDLIFRLQGVAGIYLGSNDSISLQHGGNGAEKWEPFDAYQQKYEHPLWQEFADAAAKSGGHGGAEYLMFRDFLKAIREQAVPPQDVYDAADWSAIVPLSIESVAKGGRQVSFPDFTDGRWRKRKPVGV